MVEWSCGIQALSARPTGFLQCFDTVGLVIWPVKIIPDMTYNVFGGTLNLAQSITAISSDHTACIKNALTLPVWQNTVSLRYPLCQSIVWHDACVSLSMTVECFHTFNIFDFISAIFVQCLLEIATVSSSCEVAVLLLQNCLVTKFVYKVCNVNVCPCCVLLLLLLHDYVIF